MRESHALPLREERAQRVASGVLLGDGGRSARLRAQALLQVLGRRHRRGPVGCGELELEVAQEPHKPREESGQG